MREHEVFTEVIWMFNVVCMNRRTRYSFFTVRLLDNVMCSSCMLVQHNTEQCRATFLKVFKVSQMYFLLCLMSSQTEILWMYPLVFIWHRMERVQKTDMVRKSSSKCKQNKKRRKENRVECLLKPVTGERWQRSLCYDKIGTSPSMPLIL